MTTLRVMIPVCAIGLTAGYLGFGSMGIFVVASALCVLKLADVLRTAFAPSDPQRLLSWAPDSPADLEGSEAAQVSLKERSLGISVVYGRCDPGVAFK